MSIRAGEDRVPSTALGLCGAQMGKALFKQSDMERALRAASAEGFKLVRVDFDGPKTSITFEKGGDVANVVTPLDEWRAKRARETSGG